MKRKLSLLAVCIGSLGLVNAQTNSSTYSTSSTTTNSTYSTTPTTTSDMNNTTNSTSPSSNSYNSGSTTTNGSMNSSGNMNSTNSTNSMGTTDGTTTNSGTPAYGTTTTTTTTTGAYNSGNTNATVNRDNDRDWGKEGKFGVYAGVNFSRFVNEPIPDGAYRAGWQAGIYGRTGGTIFGQLGLEYRNSTTNLVRSGTGQPAQTPGEVRGQINNHFVAIPAYVGVRIGSALGLRLQAGAELSTLVINPNNNFGIQADDFRRTILSGLLGAGINLGPLTLDAVYNAGLQNVFDNNDTRRRLLALNLGFRF